MRTIVVASLSALALAGLTACNPSPASNAAANAAAPGAPVATGSGAPATTGAGGAAGPVTTSEIPHRRPGLWRQVMSMDGQTLPGPGFQLCVDEASESRMSAFAQRMTGNAHCTPPQITRNVDGTLNFAESCQIGADGRISTNGVVRGDFNSGYTEDVTTETTGAPVASMNGDHKMTITVTWMGPCAAGQRGGDIIMPNGMTRNMLDDQPPASNTAAN